MVKASVVAVLIDSLNEKQPRKMIPWDRRYRRKGNIKQSNSFTRSLIKNIRRILQAISGDKIVEMLSGIILFFNDFI